MGTLKFLTVLFCMCVRQVYKSHPDNSNPFVSRLPSVWVLFGHEEQDQGSETEAESY